MAEDTLKLTQKDLDVKDAQTERKAAESELAVITGMKKTTFDGKEVYIRFPLACEQMEMDSKLSKLITSYIRKDEFMTKREMLDLLDKKGLWTAKHEQELEEARLNYDDMNKQLYSWDDTDPDTRLSDPEYLRMLGVKNQFFIQFMGLFARRENMLEHCAEKVAEKNLIPEQVVMCIVDKDRKRIFKDAKELLENPNAQAVTELIGKAIMFWKGVDERFLEGSPVSQNGAENTEQSKTE